MTSINRILTTGDFSTLSRLSDEWSSSGLWLGLQTRKFLESVLVVFPDNLPPDVASLGSRVAYVGSRVAYDEDGKEHRTGELTALCLFERDYLPVRLRLHGVYPPDPVDA